MKIFNMEKIVLCLLCSSPSFALQSIDDAELGNIDGRAGITIETQLHDTTTIGAISYTDGDGDGLGHTNSAGIYLSDISIGASSAKSKVDVFSDGVLNIEISDIFQGDIWVRNIAMGDTETSFGAVGITNFNYDAAGTYNLKFAAIEDPRGSGVDIAAIIVDFNMASSSFDFTFVDEAEFSLIGDRQLINGNTISYTTQFSDFKAASTTVYADGSLSADGRDWIRMDLGSVSGSARLENISFSSVTAGVAADPDVLGSSGFSNISIDNTSFLALSGHEGGGTGGGGIDFKVAAKLNIENFYFETNGSRANFANISIDTDGRGTNGNSNVPFDITLDAVNSGFRKGLVLAISNVNSMDLTIRDLSVSKYNKATDTVSDEVVFGTLGIENINFNGGSAELSFIGRAASGNQGIETGFSLPDGTTLDFTINDFEDVLGNSVDDSTAAVKGGELRATIEINDFSAESVIDVIALEDGQGTGLKVTFKSMEGAFDLRNFSAGNGVTHKGSYGRIQVDGMNLKRGYLIVDAL
ncbi:MAG: DUF6160 family protein [Oleispira sp.]